MPFQLVAFLAAQEQVKLKEIKSYKTYLYSQRVQPSRMIYKHNRLNNTVLNNLIVAIPNRFTLKIKQTKIHNKRSLAISDRNSFKFSAFINDLILI